MGLKKSDLKKKNQESLYINEIFHSIQGESIKVGLPTVFVRLTGCPLRCHYCDTRYAFYEGKKMTIAHIINTVDLYKTRHVTVTGGEPLIQKNCLTLLTWLCEEDFHVSLETSGALALDYIDPRVMKIVDLKTPGSGEESKNKLAVLDQINAQDQVKFVLCDRNDYDWAKRKIDEYHLTDRCEVLFSASYKQLDIRVLAEWILEDRLSVRLQPQIHKYLWGDTPAH